MMIRIVLSMVVLIQSFAYGMDNNNTLREVTKEANEAWQRAHQIVECARMQQAFEERDKKKENKIMGKDAFLSVNRAFESFKQAYVQASVSKKENGTIIKEITDLIARFKALQVELIDLEKTSPLIKAIYEGKNLASIETLINNGCNINERDCNGRTALHWVMLADADNYQLIELLINYGANRWIRDNDNKIPVDLIDDREFAQTVEKNMGAAEERNLLKR